MPINNVQFYGLASLLVVLILLVVVTYLVWYYYWKRRGRDGFHILHTLPEKLQVVNENPKIQLNTVEFTLPQSTQQRPNSYSEGLDEFNYHLDSATRHTKGQKERKNSQQSLSEPTSKKLDTRVQTSYGFLKPELYSDHDSDFDCDEDLPFGNIGRIWFNLEYDAESEKLIVTVERIRNLPGRQQRGSSLSLGSGSSCDPFIRLYLLPDEKRYLQSKMKRKTRNPTFNETFMFTMSYNLLVERTLRITVFDVDRFMRQTIIGHVLYPLQDIDITSSTKEWKDVEKSSQLSGNEGRLQIGLTHFPQFGRVAVNIIRGQKVGNEDHISPDSYVKVTYSVLNKVHKVKKTATQKASSEPFYNQTVEFKIESTGMEMACLNFEVYHGSGGVVKHDKLLGSFLIGGSMCARGRELEYWTDMMQKPKTVVKEWHDLKV